MGPTWVLSAPDGPMLAPWTLLSVSWWFGAANKPLPEPMLTKVPWSQLASVVANELTHLPLVSQYMHQWTGSVLLQVMACLLFGAKPWPQTVLAYYRNKLKWNSNQNTKFFSDENAFKNVVWKMVAILTRRRGVNYLSRQVHPELFTGYIYF